MPEAPSHALWMEQMKQVSVDAARQAVHDYRARLLQDQINKARSVVREYSSQQAPTGTVTLVPRTNNTIRAHTILIVCGTGTTVSLTLGDDTMVFPAQASGYIFLEGLDIFLGRGDKRAVVLGTPGNPIFFGVWGEQVGDAQAIG